MGLYKRIITKIDKTLHPTRYKCNSSVKPFKALCVGDKLYILTIPNLNGMSIHERLNAMNYAFLTTAEVCYSKIVKTGKKYSQSISLEFKKYNSIIRDNTAATLKVDGTLIVPIYTEMSKKSLYTFIPYNGTNCIHISSDKNDIMHLLKIYANQIKNTIKGEKDNLENTKYWQMRLINDIWQSRLINMNKYSQKIRAFKQQYNQIIYQLTLM